MTQTLPATPSVPHQSFSTELDGTVYHFRFAWNARAASWFMEIGTVEEEPIISGVRVVVRTPLIARFADVRLPPGAFVAFDTTGKDEDPGLDDLGVRVLVRYIPAADL